MEVLRNKKLYSSNTKDASLTSVYLWAVFIIFLAIKKHFVFLDQ